MWKPDSPMQFHIVYSCIDALSIWNSMDKMNREMHLYAGALKMMRVYLQLFAAYTYIG